MYDPDELQHLHAGYCLWRGVLPYRDFFEQHQPVLWYLSLPLFGIWGSSLHVIFAGRFLIWLTGALTIALTYHLGNCLFGRYAGSIAALLLVVHPPYQEKNIEWRPDNVAVPLVLGAILCLDRTSRPNGRRWAILAGCLFSAAYFCTQKVAYGEVGMIAAAICTCAAMRKSPAPPDGTTQNGTPTASGIAISLAAGAILLAIGVAAFLYQQGVLEQYIDLTVLAPLRWQTHEPIRRYVVIQLAAGALFWSLSVAGWIAATSDLIRRRSSSLGVAAITGGALTHALGLLHVPAAFHQYYLPLSPLVALLAAHVLTIVVNSDGRNAALSRTVVLLATVSGISVLVIGLACRSLDTNLAPAWILLIIVLALISAALCLFGYRHAGVLLTLAASVLGSLEYHRIQFGWSHAHQTGQIEALMRATDSNDAFLDGFTGLGALRPHAFHFFWINHHSWPMIPAPEKLTGIADALRNPGTRVVLFDPNLDVLLPSTARQVIDDQYTLDPRYSDFPRVIVYVRRERPLADITTSEK
jgi:hypothetical protein